MACKFTQDGYHVAKSWDNPKCVFCGETFLVDKPVDKGVSNGFVICTGILTIVLIILTWCVR